MNEDLYIWAHKDPKMANILLVSNKVEEHGRVLL